MVEQAFESIEEAAKAWTGALRAVDPGVLDGAGCERLLDLVIRVGRTEAAVKARLVKRAREANRWKEKGHRNPDDWLAEKEGTSTGRAKAEREHADDLAGAPATEKALEHGEISPDQAKEIAAAANADPSAEQQLLDLAKRKESMTELRRRARKARAAAMNDEERKAKIRRERSFTSWTNPEGAFCFRGQGLPEDGAKLLAALKPHQDATFAAARAEGRREPPQAYAYDAFMALLAHQTGAARCHGSDNGTGGAGRRDRSPGTGTGTGRHDGSPGGGGNDHGGSSPRSGRSDGGGKDPGTGRPGTGPTGPTGPGGGGSGGPPGGNGSPSPGRTGSPGAGRGVAGRSDDRPAGGGGGASGTGCACSTQRSRPPAKIILHVDLTALDRGHTVPGETCEIAGIGPVAVSTARELLGDAFLALVISDGVDVRNVTHLGRAPTSHQRTALEARGMRCEVPGCNRTTTLEIDHVDGWAITKRTHVDQLAWLCAGRGGHHHQKTHDGFTLTGPPGDRSWHPPSRDRVGAG